MFPNFDRIAKLMDVPSPTLEDTYADDVKKMKLSLLNYVKALQAMRSEPNLPFGIGTTLFQPKLVLETTSCGFPILPVPLPLQNWNKQDWESLFTLYMGRHYCKVH